ncbi:hypothetical protein KD913_12640 [Klebsiella pneumoniae]
MLSADHGNANGFSCKERASAAATLSEARESSPSAAGNNFLFCDIVIMIL